MDEKDELNYELGNRAAWLSMLQSCLRQLGIDDEDAGRARWVSEREQTVAALRSVCERHGDNEWDEDLHLADVVSKHLERHLDA